MNANKLTNGEYTVEEWKASKISVFQPGVSGREMNAVKKEILGRPGVMKVHSHRGLITIWSRPE